MLLGSFERSHSLADAIGLNCEIWKAREYKALSNQLVAGAQRAQVHEVDQAWRVFHFLCTPTHSLVNRFIAWRAAKRFFTKFFGFFFFSITHRHVILCLHSSSLLFQLSFYCCNLINIVRLNLFNQFVGFIPCQIFL